MIRIWPVVLVYFLSIFSSNAEALFFDGTGHYSLRGETRTAPGMANDSGMIQVFEHNFRLETEARFNDRGSFFTEFRLFDTESANSFLGDQVEPANCDPVRNTDGTTSTECKGRHQNTAEPGYSSYLPQIKKAYIRYGFDYCLLEAGRRGRDWGMGLLVDSGNDPFDTSISTFDGITCDVNIQRFQDLGFSFGYDKLSETGALPYNPHFDRRTPPAGDDSDAIYDKNLASKEFGATNRGDDHDQFFLTIELDDRKLNQTKGLTKHLGIYFANVISPSRENGGSGTDLKFIDFYTAFYTKSLAFKNEILFRHGKSADPNFVRLGGAREDNEDAALNDLQSLGMAGKLEWTFASSGYAGSNAIESEAPVSGDRHVLGFEWAFAPGSGQGYYQDLDTEGNDMADDLSILRRSNKASAMAFNENYSPAMVLFNARKDSSYLRVDGAFDPRRVMNTNLFALSYRYENVSSGNFELKLITANLTESLPAEVSSYYEASEDRMAMRRPIGYYGDDLGLELDMKYWLKLNRDADFGLAAAYVKAGSAWKTLEGQSPKNNMLLQTYLSFQF